MYNQAGKDLTGSNAKFRTTGSRVHPSISFLVFPFPRLLQSSHPMLSDRVTARSLFAAARMQMSKEWRTAKAKYPAMRRWDIDARESIHDSEEKETLVMRYHERRQSLTLHSSSFTLQTRCFFRLRIIWNSRLRSVRKHLNICTSARV